MTTGSLAWDKWFKEIQQGFEVSRSMAPKRIRLTMAERLQKRLSDALGEPVSLPQRLYHGRCQRQAGAWSWFCYRKCGRYQVGSQWSMKEVLATKTYAELDNLVDWHY
jgi:hypothetical protein